MLFKNEVKTNNQHILDCEQLLIDAFAEIGMGIKCCSDSKGFGCIVATFSGTEVVTFYDVASAIGFKNGWKSALDQTQN